MDPGDQKEWLSPLASVEDRAADLRRAVADKSIHALGRDGHFHEAVARLADDALAASGTPCFTSSAALLSPTLPRTSLRGE
jgi:hypothetical protein